MGDTGPAAASGRSRSTPAGRAASVDGETSQNDWRNAPAVSLLIARVIAAVIVTVAACSWGYNYVYVPSTRPDIIVTAGGRLQDFSLTAGWLLSAYAALPVLGAISIVGAARRRTLPRAILAATLPNVACGGGVWAVTGMGWTSLLLTLPLIALGSVTFFLAVRPRRETTSTAPPREDGGETAGGRSRERG